MVWSVRSVVLVQQPGRQFCVVYTAVTIQLYGVSTNTCVPVSCVHCCPDCSLPPAPTWSPLATPARNTSAQALGSLTLKSQLWRLPAQIAAAARCVYGGMGRVGTGCGEGRAAGASARSRQQQAHQQQRRHKCCVCPVSSYLRSAPAAATGQQLGLSTPCHDARHCTFGAGHSACISTLYS
jgi:hypothetical protein